ncbi:MAG: hypothetical protein LBT59_10735 [Clostridiales bacterium]|nr:hypothetical protein [Clostridiales bacterium]
MKDSDVLFYSPGCQIDSDSYESMPWSRDDSKIFDEEEEEGQEESELGDDDEETKKKKKKIKKEKASERFIIWLMP